MNEKCRQLKNALWQIVEKEKRSILVVIQNGFAHIGRTLIRDFMIFAHEFGH